jgi:alkaline phosphatase
MNKIAAFLLMLAACKASGQAPAYNAGNLHSHNDYEQPAPFRAAYNQGFGSIEADIFIQPGNLIVAHDTVELKLRRSLDSMYLQPLEQCIKRNNGFPYSDHSKVLQLLVDIKTDSVATLDRLVKKLESYPAITSCKSVKIVISGNRPAPLAFANYPGWIYFDGELHVDYPAAAIGKIEMLSDNFRKYSYWNGIDTIPARDKMVLAALIAKGHRLHKKVRFWNAPDFINSWKLFMELGVDYINTDHVTTAANFLEQAGKH